MRYVPIKALHDGMCLAWDEMLHRYQRADGNGNLAEP